MPRCACGAGTCSCHVDPTNSVGVTVGGDGSSSDPWTFSVDRSVLDIAGIIDFQDSTTVEFSQQGDGSQVSPLEVYADAKVSTAELTDGLFGEVPVTGEVPTWSVDHWEWKPVPAPTSMKMADLSDVVDTPAPTTGQVPTWNGTAYAPATPSVPAGTVNVVNPISGDGSGASPLGLKTSGVWPLTNYPPTQPSTDGGEVYVDSAGQVRAKPQVITVAKPVTDLISTYPNGITVMTIGGTDGVNWPTAASSIVVTEKRGDSATGGQWCYLNSSTVTQAYYRNGNSSGWAPWVQVVGPTVLSLYSLEVADIALAAATDVIANFSTAEASHADLPYSAGVWTVKQPGVYQVSGSLFYEKATTGSPRIYANLYVNNTQVGQQVNTANSTNYSTLPFSWVRRLAANDAVKMMARCDIANTLKANSTGFQTSCSILKVGT